MIKKIKEWDITIKCVVLLFLLRNMILHPVIRNEAEEYLESHRILLSDWKDEIDGPWYKEATYFDKSIYYEEAYLSSDQWEVIQYDGFKNSCYRVSGTRIDILLNPTARIRKVTDDSAGQVFIIVRMTKESVPYICVLPKDHVFRNALINRLQKCAINGDRNTLIKLINMNCETYKMLSGQKEDIMSKMWTFGRQNYINGIVNDGLYIYKYGEDWVRQHVQKTV